MSETGTGFVLVIVGKMDRTYGESLVCRQENGEVQQLRL